MVDFHQSVSDRSIYLRYFQFLKLSQRVSHERLIRICSNDYDREIALVAVDGPRILAVGRLRRTGEEDAEFGVLVIDSAQGMGLGTEMVERLIRIARAEGVRMLHADVHGENGKMLHLLRKLDFKLRSEPGDPVYQAARPLNG
jgi:acetyltransferase